MTVILTVYEKIKSNKLRCLQGNRKLYFCTRDLKNDQIGFLELKNVITKLKT